MKEELTSIFAVFKSKKFEHSYRQQGLGQDKYRFKVIIIIFKSSHPIPGNNIIVASYLFINLLGISVDRQMHINNEAVTIFGGFC